MNNSDSQSGNEKKSLSIQPQGFQELFYDEYTFAQLVGVTESRIRELRVKGHFLPVKKGGRGRGAKNLYSHRQIQDFKNMFVSRRTVNSIAKKLELAPIQEIFPEAGRTWFTGEEAKTAFHHFNQGKLNSDLTIEYGIHPNTVKVLRRAWQEANEDECALVLTKNDITVIEGMALDGPFPLSSGKDLIEVITLLINDRESDALCMTCSKDARRFCLACAKKYYNPSHGRPAVQTQTTQKEDE